jgi:hypothetical protein
MKNFENKISDLIKQNVQFVNKDALRHKILTQHVVKTQLEHEIVATLASQKLSVNRRVLMKEKLMLLVNASVPKWYEQLFYSHTLKRGVAFSLLFVLTVGLVFQPFSATEVVKAYTPTKISMYSGNVFVERKGQVFPVTKDFVLFEGDVVQTGPAGFVEIVFADESISRLSNSTKIHLTKLDNKVVNANTEVDLVRGELWVNTLGLNGVSANFSVNSEGLTTSVNSKAVFDKEITDNFVRVVSLENSLDLELLEEDSLIPAKLKKGQLVKVKKDTPYNTYLDQVAFEDRLSDFNLDWIASNYKQDEFYVETLSENRIIDLEEKAGITPDSYFYPVKEFQRAARLAITFDPIKQAELQLAIANQKLIEAEVLIDKGKTDKATEILDDYSRNLTEVVKKVSNLDANVDVTNQDDLKQLKENLVASVSIPKKSLTDVLPTEAKYEFKQTLNQAEIIVAETEVEKKKVQISQANQILDEAKLLAESNQKDLAKEKLDRYLTEISRISTEFDGLSTTDKAVVMSAIIESNLDGIAALESLKPVVAASPVDSSISAAEQAKESVDSVDFDKKLEEVTEISKENLSQTLIQASQVKSPEVVTQLNKVNATLELTDASVQQIDSVVQVQEVIIQPESITVVPEPTNPTVTPDTGAGQTSTVPTTGTSTVSPTTTDSMPAQTTNSTIIPISPLNTQSTSTLNTIKSQFFKTN